MGKRLSLYASYLAISAALMTSPLQAHAENLNDALAASYSSHPQLKAQREALQALDERVAQAVSGWRPSISAAVQRGRQRTSFEDSEWSHSDKKLKQLTLSQPLFQGGQTIANTRSAKALVKSGRAELLDAEQSVLIDAVSAYMGMVQAQSVHELSRKNVEVLKQQQKAARERFAVGEVTRTDVAQSDARVERAKSDFIEAQGALETSKATYLRVIGKAPEGVSLPAEMPQIPDSLDEVVNIALAENPQVQAAKYRKLSARYDVNSQFGGLLPKLSLDASMRRDEGTGVSGASKFDTDSVLLNLSIPLYQSGSQYSRIRAAKNIQQQRKFEEMDSEQEARQLATQAWEGLQTARATIASNQAAIDAARIALDGVKQEHQYGTRTTLDVLNAEQELFLAQVNLVRSQRNEVIAQYNVLAVMGKLSAADLNLPVETYNPKEHYDDIKYQFIGF